MRRALLIITLVATLAAPAASVAAKRHQTAGTLLGVHGSLSRFAAQTGQQSEINQVFVSFAQAGSLPRVVAQMGPVPLLALVPGSYGQRETATPKGIATGQTDQYLLALNAAISSFNGSRFYLRPFPEMNGYWESVCAFNKDGSPRGRAHTTAWVRKAFARVAVISRGGQLAAINSKLARLGLPPLHSDGDLPSTVAKLRVVWNPQGFGAPDLPGNSAQAYYPGDAYVDVVGDDLYDMPGHGATWAAAEAMYKSHPAKPFAFPEWGLWGLDDPQFVRDMAQWLHTHRRTEFIAYFSGHPGSVWDLGSKPRSRAAYRIVIAPLGATP